MKYRYIYIVLTTAALMGCHQTLPPVTTLPTPPASPMEDWNTPTGAFQTTLDLRKDQRGALVVKMTCAEIENAGEGYFYQGYTPTIALPAGGLIKQQGLAQMFRLEAKDNIHMGLKVSGLNDLVRWEDPVAEDLGRYGFIQGCGYSQAARDTATPTHFSQYDYVLEATVSFGSYNRGQIEMNRLYCKRAAEQGAIQIQGTLFLVHGCLERGRRWYVVYSGLKVDLHIKVGVWDPATRRYKSGSEAYVATGTAVDNNIESLTTRDGVRILNLATSNIMGKATMNALAKIVGRQTAQ